MEDWEAMEAKMVLVEAIDKVQEVQEGLESVRTLLGSVREVLLAQAGVEPVQEVPEVQDHPNRLPPDLAALAHRGSTRHPVFDHCPSKRCRECRH